MARILAALKYKRKWYKIVISWMIQDVSHSNMLVYFKHIIILPCVFELWRKLDKHGNKWKDSLYANEHHVILRLIFQDLVALVYAFYINRSNCQENVTELSYKLLFLSFLPIIRPQLPKARPHYKGTYLKKLYNFTNHCHVLYNPIQLFKHL